MKAQLLAALAATLAACATTSPSNEQAAIADRQILVTIKQPPALAVGLTGAPNQRYLQRRYGPSPTVDRILSQLAHDHDLQRVDGWPIESLGVYCEVLSVPGERNVGEIVGLLAKDTRIDLVQRMNLFDTQTTHYDDPYIELQSAAVELEVEQAHSMATGRGVSVAIIDSGVDSNHPDLRGRVQFARNLVTTHPNPRGGEVHGTAIAGIIASAVNNNEGIIGVAPDVTIAALRACWAVDDAGLAAQCSSFSLARALEVALSLRPNVINLSLAGPDDPLLGSLLDVAIRRGIVIVTAHPETPLALHAFPSSHPHVLAARSSKEVIGSDSPYDLPAPASEILTTTPGASYAFLSGNSLAAAHTTGVVALLMEQQPGLDTERIAAILSASKTRGPNSISINACRALASRDARAPCADQPPAGRF